LKIGIVAAASSGQAAVVRDSIESFFRYGVFQYKLIELRRGEIREEIQELDALIIHYNCIAFPYRYELPMNALSALKIRQFSGLKLVLVQDEQRSCYERLNFFNNLRVNHVFSVAPENLYENLYPSKHRNFSVSTILTGYISDKHIEVASRHIPLADRPIDLAYRGRSLPNWMGKTGTLKGHIPELISQVIKNENDYIIDVSNREQDRIYGQEWFKFLLKSKVSIGTPSGSDYLDLWGTEIEEWARKKTKVISKLAPAIPADYTVISPRYFDYVASGNLVALTPGNYSDIPNENDFLPIRADLSDLETVLQFSNSIEAQRIVDQSKERIFSRNDLRYSGYVAEIEKKILLFSQKTHQPISKLHINLENQISTQKNPSFLTNKIRLFLNRYSIIRNLVLAVREFFFTWQDLLETKNISLLKKLPGYKFWFILNFRLILELVALNEVLLIYGSMPKIENLGHTLKLIFVTEPNEIEILLDYPEYFVANSWFIDLSKVGTPTKRNLLISLPKALKHSPKLLAELLTNLLKHDK
jgi:hypothetical protein